MPKGGGNKFLEDNVNHGTRSEKRVASALHGHTRLGSGSLAGLKGDSTAKAPTLSGTDDRDMLIESKATIHQSLGVQKKWLDKITEEALGEGRIPALSMSFVTKDGQPQAGASDWIAVPLWWWKEQMENDKT